MRLCRQIRQEARRTEQEKILLLKYPGTKPRREAAREHRQARETVMELFQQAREHQAAREHRRAREARRFRQEAREHHLEAAAKPFHQAVREHRQAEPPRLRQRLAAEMQQLREKAPEFLPHPGRWLHENSRTGAGRF